MVGNFEGKVVFFNFLSDITVDLAIHVRREDFVNINMITDFNLD